MKKLLILIAFIFATLTLKSQTVYIAMQPVDLGLGIRYDKYFKHAGIYTSASYGNYWLNEQKTAFIKSHVKLTGGILIPVNHQINFTSGLNYHWWRAVHTDIKMNPIIFNHWSFELGISTRFKYLAVGVRTDILRWEPCFDVGLNF